MKKIFLISLNYCLKLSLLWSPSVIWKTSSYNMLIWQTVVQQKLIILQDKFGAPPTSPVLLARQQRGDAMRIPLKNFQIRIPAWVTLLVEFSPGLLPASASRWSLLTLTPRHSKTFKFWIGYMQLNHCLRRIMNNWWREVNSNKVTYCLKYNRPSALVKWRKQTML